MKVGISQVQHILGLHHAAVTALTVSSELHQVMADNGLNSVYASNDRHIGEMLKELLSRFDVKPDYVIMTHSLPYLLGRTDVLDQIEGPPAVNISGIPCCILHKGIQIAVSLVRSGRYKRVLVIGADKCYANHERLFFGTAMSDIVIGLLVEASFANNEILGSVVNTTILAPNGVYSPLEATSSFRMKNPSFVRTAIMDCLKQANIELGELDYIVCHTSNTKIWDQVSSLMKLPRSKFLDINISDTGHMNSNDSFYHYFDYVRKGVIQKGQKVMLVNPGFGGSQGCTLISC